MSIERDVVERVKLYLKRKEFIAITGPRQCGKTTLLEILKEYLLTAAKVQKENIHLVTFEDRRLLSQFEDDPVAFVQSFIGGENRKTKYLTIDEFQYAEEGGQKLKLIYDTVKNVKIIITGSSSLEIKAQVGKYMVGRILSFNLCPFNFHEYLRSKDSRLEQIYSAGAEITGKWLAGKKIDVKNKEDSFSNELLRHYEQYCGWGGYPAGALAKNNEEKTKNLRELYNKYVL